VQADIPGGWTGVGLHDLNNRGDILGSGVFGGVSQLFLLRAVAAPVPEPATWAMGLLGALAVIARARRRAPTDPPLRQP